MSFAKISHSMTSMTFYDSLTFHDFLVLENDVVKFMTFQVSMPNMNPKLSNYVIQHQYALTIKSNCLVNFTLYFHLTLWLFSYYN